MKKYTIIYSQRIDEPDNTSETKELSLDWNQGAQLNTRFEEQVKRNVEEFDPFETFDDLSDPVEAFLFKCAVGCCIIFALFILVLGVGCIF